MARRDLTSGKGHNRRSRTVRSKSGVPITADLRGTSIYFGSGRNSVLVHMVNHQNENHAFFSSITLVGA
jgi:hypothetical protein